MTLRPARPGRHAPYAAEVAGTHDVAAGPATLDDLSRRAGPPGRPYAGRAMPNATDRAVTP